MILTKLRSIKETQFAARILGVQRLSSDTERQRPGQTDNTSAAENMDAQMY